MKRERMVKFYYAGVFFYETSVKECPDDNPMTITIPEAAYGFQFFDRVTQTAVLEDRRTIEHVEVENESGMFYPDAEALTLSDIPDTERFRVLRSNMEVNGWRTVVKTRHGNYQPLEDGDTVLAKPSEAMT